MSKSSLYRYYTLLPVLFIPLTACQKPEAKGEPPILESLRQKGVVIVDTFTSKGGLKAWVGFVGDQPIAFYLTPDGKYVITGSVLDSNLEDVNQGVIEQKLKTGLTANVWENVEKSNWVQDGKADAPRIVYIFTDVNCGYCNKLWTEARPWVESGKVQLRHIMVGIIRDNSSAKAAAVLAAKDPAEKLAGHGNYIMSGRQEHLRKNDIEPLEIIPAEIQAKIDANHKLMASLRLQATPSLVWLDESGAVQVRTGAPDHTIREALGPRP